MKCLAQVLQMADTEEMLAALLHPPPQASASFSLSSLNRENQAGTLVPFFLISSPEFGT